MEKDSMSEKIVKESIEKFGVISISYIMRKLKLTHKGALKIMEKYKYLLTLASALCIMLFASSCNFRFESGITPKNSSNTSGACMEAGQGYRDSVFAAINCSGKAYEESQDRAKNADEQLPPGEHPLDDENIDNWDGTLGYYFKGDFLDEIFLREFTSLHRLSNGEIVHGSNATWCCSNCGWNNYSHNGSCSNCGESK